MESQMPKDATNGTSTLLDSIVRTWLFVLAKAYQYDLPGPTEMNGVTLPGMAEIWIKAIGDTKPSVVELAFDLLLKTWKPDYGRKFPAPADLLGLVPEAYETVESRESYQRQMLKTAHAQELPGESSTPLTREQFKEAFDRARADLGLPAYSTPIYVPRKEMTEAEFAEWKAKEHKKIEEYMARNKKP